MTKKFTFFNEHPELYEEGFDSKKIAKQVKFLDKIFSHYGLKRILDIACGHTPQGRRLAKLGYNVSGIDLSSSLLKLAKKRASEEGVKINFHRKDMRNFSIGKFDAAYILFSSILHLYTSRDLISHFDAVNRNLKKGGLYIIDLSDLPYENSDEEDYFKKKKGDLVTEITYTPSKKHNSRANFKCVSIFKGEKVNEDSFTVLRAIAPDLMRKLARDARFEILDVFSDFNFKKNFNKNKFEYIVVLRKVK